MLQDALSDCEGKSEGGSESGMDREPCPDTWQEVSGRGRSDGQASIQRPKGERRKGSWAAEGSRANGSRARGGDGRMVDGQGKSILQVTYPGSFGTRGFGRRPPSGCTVGGRDE